MKYFIFIICFFNINQVVACACCGIDNTWKNNIMQYGSYSNDIFQQLVFPNGTFDDGPRAELMVKLDKISLTNQQFTYASKFGDFTFVFEEKITHKQSDITFAINEDYQQIDDATIYHEFILKGTLKLPAKLLNTSAASGLHSSYHATLVIQGTGNACIEPSTLRRWMIKITDQPLYTAYGKINK